MWSSRATAQAATAAVALAVGLMAAPGFAHAGETRRASEMSSVSKKLEKQVIVAERAVAKAPRDAGARLQLGQSYLAAGRFASAAASFEDAVALGDQSPATALRMALSYMGAGRNLEAVALLEQWRESIPASDYGLALALAGQPGQAVTVLGDAIQHGENTSKARQNLAYAYALGGRLREARVIAAYDVPADQIEARISDWALQASIGSQQSRVAVMLGAPVRNDPGQPTALALSTPADAAAFATRAMPAPPLAMAGELPALNRAAPPMAPVFSQAEPEAVPTAAAAPEPVGDYAPVAPAPVLAAAGPASALRFVSNPVLQDISRYSEVEARPAAMPATVRTAVAPPLPATKPLPTHAQPDPAVRARPVRTAASTHAVQLGSFFSEESARRAWDVYVGRDPSLRERELRITQAVVNGRRYWRVAAVGYDAVAARHMCSAVRSRGRDCLAYAERQPRSRSLPSGAVAPRFAGR
jgi:Flp pilus assembly protein TadD